MVTEIDAETFRERLAADEIVVACPIGESSRQAARLLVAYEGVDEDATVADLPGGYRDWDGGLERA